MLPLFYYKDVTDDDYSLFRGEYSSGSSGIMRFEDGALVMEFVTAKSEYSMTSYKQKRTDVQTRIIPLHLIQSIECKRWRFRNARPASLHYSPLDALANALVMESLAVAFDSVEIE